ncbi:MAG: DUF6232 family protein [Chloroflexi bacterium]|nr:DUF6232 family protein [Chloroflexota bacterium]
MKRYNSGMFGDEVNAETGPKSNGHHNGSGKTERLFFDDEGVLVTQHRFVSQGTTYQVDAITSVRMKKVTLNSGWAWGVGGIGILVLLLGVSIRIPFLIAIGVLMLGGGGFWLLIMKPVHAVFITTEAGEVQAVTSDDEFRVRRIVAALNDAIEAGE